MPSPAGIAAQLMIAEESTYGTFVTPTRGLDLVSETMKNQTARIESKGIRANRRVVTTPQWAPGAQIIGGDLNLELATTQFGLIWKHCLGAIATTGSAGVGYTHTATPGDLVGVGMSVQVGRPDISGTVRAFSYAGCKVNAWELSCKVNEIADLKLTLAAQSESTATALATFPTLAATYMPQTFVGGQITIAGTVVPVTDVTLKGANTLDDKRLYLRNSAQILEPLANGWREYTCDVTSDFVDLTQYARFTGATEFAVVLSFAGAGITGTAPPANYTTTITMNARLDGETPNVSGPQILKQPLHLKATASGSSDSSAITVAYLTSDSTP